MGEVRTWVPAGGPAGAGAAADAAGAGAGGAAAAPADMGMVMISDIDGIGGAALAAAPESAGAATAMVCWACWPSIFRRKPERSSSRPWSRLSATSPISSLICSKVSTQKPPWHASRGAASTAPGSGEIFLQEQTRSPELEPGLPVVPLRAQDEKQIIVRGDGAYHQRQAVGHHRQLLHLPDVQLAVVLADRPRLGHQLGREHLQVQIGVRADRLDRNPVLRHQGQSDRAVDPVADTAELVKKHGSGSPAAGASDSC